MSHDSYWMKWRGKRVNEPWFKYECVGGTKHYVSNVFWVKIWSFNWSAKTCTYKTGWTFDPKSWVKFEPGPDVAIKQWDVLILDIGKDWHVCVGHNQVYNWYYVIEQNRNNSKTWIGPDAINIWFYDYSTRIINIYRRK